MVESFFDPKDKEIAKSVSEQFKEEKKEETTPKASVEEIDEAVRIQKIKNAIDSFAPTELPSGRVTPDIAENLKDNLTMKMMAEMLDYDQEILDMCLISAHNFSEIVTNKFADTLHTYILQKAIKELTAKL